MKWMGRAGPRLGGRPADSLEARIGLGIETGEADGDRQAAG
jgi:hypothetical protein